MQDIITTKTGQLQHSKIPNCPVFTPKKLTKKLYSKIEVSEEFNIEKSSIFGSVENVIQHYLLKFLAGDKNTKSGFADVSIEELFLWKEVKIGKSVFVKNVCNSIKRFEEALLVLDKQNKISVKRLIQINKNLRPKDKRFGVRTCGMKVGNPALNPDAFYALSPELIDEYLSDLHEFINQEKSESINRAFVLILQFIFIHPFIDGNGRVSRLLFLAQLKENRIYAMIVMLYLKTINLFSYHRAMNDYRQGEVKKLQKVHAQAIKWANQSIQILSDLINAYIKQVTQDKLDNNESYAQIIVKSNDKIDDSVFQFHSKKVGKNIYINTALLNVLNQFEYYLRYELRKHQQC